jgi:ribulose-phosphate 3-epimerase
VRHYKEAYPNKIIEVDGGISPSNSGRLTDAGADILVAGSAIFKADDPIEIVKIMKGS